MGKRKEAGKGNAAMQASSNPFAGKYMLAGFSGCSAIRALGKEGFSPKEIRAICKAEGIGIAAGTIAIQSAAGRKGDSRGKAADIPKKEIARLRAIGIAQIAKDSKAK